MIHLFSLLFLLQIASATINLLSCDDPARIADRQARIEHMHDVDSPATRGIVQEYRKQMQSAQRYQEQASCAIIYHSDIRGLKGLNSEFNIHKDLKDTNVSWIQYNHELFPKNEKSYGSYRNAEEYTTSTSSEQLVFSLYKDTFCIQNSVARPTQIPRKTTVSDYETDMSMFVQAYVNKRTELLMQPIKVNVDLMDLLHRVQSIKERGYYETKGLYTAAIFLLCGPIISAAVKPFSANGMKLCIVLGAIGGAFGLGKYLYNRYHGYCETKPFHDQQTEADTFAVNSGATKEKKIVLAKAGIDLLSSQGYCNADRFIVGTWMHESSPSIWFTHAFKSKKDRIKHLQKMITDLETQK